MKKIALVLIFASFSAIAGYWSLIGSTYNSGVWYCTYQLSGTNIQQTQVRKGGCPTYLSN